MLHLSFKWPNIKKTWLLCCLVNSCFACYTQNGIAVTRQPLHKTFDVFSYSTSYSYTNNIAQHLISRIDSIAHTVGIASHFCKAYSRSMQNIAVQMQGMDSAAQLFIKKFEIRFAAYFLDAWNEYENGNLLTASVWNCYYSGKASQPWQFVLLGVNAHVNGDMWQALVNEFSEKEIRQYKKLFMSFQNSVAKNYDVFFDELMDQNSYVTFINAFTKGLAKFTGERVINKWRSRQVKLAIMFYHDHEKFKKKLAIISSKKQKVDQLILRKTKTIV